MLIAKAIGREMRMGGKMASGKRVIQLVAVAGMAMAAVACNGSNPPDPDPVPPAPVTTSQPAPPPVTTTPPAPPPQTTSQAVSEVGPYESTCYYTVGILGEGLTMTLYDQTTSCADAAAAFENAIGNAYAVAGAENSVSVAYTLCGGTISDSAGNYTVTVYASPDTGIQNAIGSQDPVCLKLGWMHLRSGGRCPAEGRRPQVGRGIL